MTVSREIVCWINTDEKPLVEGYSDSSTPPMVNVAFECQSGPQALKLSLAQSDDLVAAIQGALQKFDEESPQPDRSGK